MSHTKLIKDLVHSTLLLFTTLSQPSLHFSTFPLELLYILVDSLRVLEGSPWEGGTCMVSPAAANGVNGDKFVSAHFIPTAQPIPSLLCGVGGEG